jgi:hypothetical protein
VGWSGRVDWVEKGEESLGGGRVSTRLRWAVESDEGVGMWGAAVDSMRDRFFEVRARELNAPAVRATVPHAPHFSHSFVYDAHCDMSNSWTVRT